MPTTRSATVQPKLEEVKGTVTDSKKANESRKRKAPPEAASSKKRKTADAGTNEGKTTAKGKAANKPKTDNSTTDDADPIAINRAPVLELWTSCVAHFVYPELSWDTCLSIGCAVASITAMAKGRSIGVMEKPDPGEAAERREKRKEKVEHDELDEVDLMSFHLKLKDGQAMVGEKPKKGNETTLRKKYGDEQYDKAKQAMQEGVNEWKGKEDQLSHEAFKMYEQFRPNIPPGQKGWGRKGQLNLQNVKTTINPD
ncbi:hypothetical protein LTR56_008200 [Elasticomyces elasticus]|nr:hypothetical protein LTR56_008200 [Elasticomyces elasticus]KAK3661765.1 hypothetical protein LTR22_007346 [Elasticomyces elasticus]KAK4924370.1 hypothetical protein LTR49_008459 [Elasticomyces elasticus]KAK5762666.1 hypothetical protein LTS12_007258 [Elasticomyces elasticus]